MTTRGSFGDVMNKRFVLVALLCVLFPAVSIGQVPFSTTPTYIGNEDTRWVEGIDVNRDGFDDIGGVLDAGGDTEAAIMVGTGWAALTYYTLIGGDDSLEQASFADFNEDGWPDMYARYNGLGQGFYVWYHTENTTPPYYSGTPTFTTGTSFFNQIHHGDVDEDGYIDIITSDFPPTFWRDTGGGMAQSVKSFTGDPFVGGSGDAIEVVDLSGDGLPEIYVAGDAGQGTWRIEHDTADDYFVTDLGMYNNAQDFVSGDFDGDGDTDLVILAGGFDRFVRNNGGFSVTQQAISGATSDTSIQGAVADFNRDGRDDIAVIQLAPPGVTLYRGTPTGPTFWAALPAPSNPASIAVLDENRDGAMDIVVGQNGGGMYSYRNQILQPPGTCASGSNSACYPNQRCVAGACVQRAGYSSFVDTAGAENPTQFEFGDVNQDGWLDAVVSYSASAGNPTAYVHFGDGSGLTAPNYTAFDLTHAGETSKDIDLSDCDLDGDLDALLVHQVGVDRAVSVYKYDGAMFTFSDNIQGTTTYTRAIWTDVNSDGWPDIITGSDSDPTTLFLNGGNCVFNFAAPDWTGPALQVGALAAGNINGTTTQNPTVFYGYNNSGNLRRWDGAQMLQIGSVSYLGNTSGAVFGDFTRDGRLDVAVSANGGQRRLTILRSTGTTSPTVVPYDVLQIGGADIESVDAASAVGSSAADLVVVGGNNDFHLYRDGKGALIKTGAYPGTSSVTYDNVRFGDVNGDGTQDFAAINVGDQEIDIIYGLPRVFGSEGVSLPFRATSTEWGDIQTPVGNWPEVVYRHGVTNLFHFLRNNITDFSGAPNTIAAVAGAADYKLADINSDGILDLIIVETNQQDYFALGNTSGGFDGLRAIGGAGLSSRVVAPIDFDNDGDMDIIIGTNGQLVSFEYDHTTNNYGPQTGVENPTIQFSDIEVADFDADGDLDFLATGFASQTFSRLYENDGTGSFNPIWTAPADNYNDAALLDFNQDGFVDIVYAVVGGGNRTFRSLAGTNFTPVATTNGSPLESSESTKSVVTGDLTGDGRREVVFGSDAGPIRAYTVSNGGFFDQIWSTERENYVVVPDVNLVDIDTDGDLDLIASFGASEDVRLFRNSTISSRKYKSGATAQMRHVTANHDSFAVLNRPGGGANSRDYASAKILDADDPVPISFTLFDRDNDSVPRVLFELSENYGPWSPITVSGNTTNLPATVQGQIHGVTWDPMGQELIDARIRIRVIQGSTAKSGGHIISAHTSTISPNFRTQILDCNPMCLAGETCVEGNCVQDCPCGTDVCLTNNTCAPTTAGMCAFHSDCPGTESCYLGQCYDPCSSITCPTGQVCYQSACYSACIDDGDCSPPFSCFENRCTDDPCASVECPDTQTCFGGACFNICTTSAECGGNTCYESGTDDRCADDPCRDIQCPSGQSCYLGGCYPSCVDDGDCTPPNLCFDGICTEDPCASTTCPVGQICYEGGCYTACANSAECTPPEECYDATRCASDPCDGILCPSGQSCYQGACFSSCADDGDCTPPNYCFDGRCTDDPCAGVQCPDGQFCYEGGCFIGCTGDTDCTPPEQCWTNRCAVDPCDNIGCPAGQVCYQGGCYPNCGDDADCTPPAVCYDGRCSDDPCAGVECPIGEICVGGTCHTGCAFNTDCPNYQGQGSVFTDVAGGTNTLVSGSKEGGVNMNDFNNDGCLDLIVGSSSFLNHIHFDNDCNFPDPIFTPKSQCDRPHFYRRTRPRSNVSGDLNHDGWPDYVRNDSTFVQIYLNDQTGRFLYNPNGSNPNCPATALTDWSPGGGHTVYSGTRFGNGINAEGVILIDYDGDKDLDIFIEDDGDGLIVMRNNICSGGVCGPPSSFSMTEINAGSIGISTAFSNGDYCAVADIDVDGDVDFLCREPGSVRDLYINNGAGGFVGSSTFNQSASNNKGGAAFCDFDNDGDFDLFWTDNGTNQIWEQTAPNTWSATGEPAASSGVSLPNNIDGVVCGDVDNDGDVDLFLTASGDDYLFLNRSSGGVWDFNNDNLGITGDDDGEGVVMGDYDRSGSLDIFINQYDTQFWENPRTDDRYLMIRALVDLGGGVTRDGIGATITIRDADGAILGLREVNGGRGHGSQDPSLVHYGLPYGANVPYSLTVQYPHGPTVEKCIVPSSISGYQQIEITDTDSDDLTSCAAAGAWTSLIELPSAGEFCFTDHCAETECDGIQCGSEFVCFGGNCKESCTTSFTCPAGEICDNGVCVNSGDPACDGTNFNCPTNWECIGGECFPLCEDDGDCSPGEICYNGICTDTSCGTVACGPGEVCHQGVCFGVCAVDSDCPAGENCYEGRCATDGCQALTVNYDADFLFRKLGRTVTAYQASTAWFWPRPVDGAGTVSSYVALSGGTSTNPDVPSPGKARVVLYLDPTENNGSNPLGRYMLWLQHGASVGQGAASATYRVRLDDPSTDDPSVILDDDAEGFRVLDTYNWVIQAQATSGANDTGGVVIGPIDAERNNNWTIQIDAAFAGDITDWEFWNADGQIVPLKMGETLMIRAGDFNITDPIIGPDSYMPCVSNRRGYRGNCRRGFGYCNNERGLVCQPTVAQWRYEICDGEDNDCDGFVDERVALPQPEYRQNTGDAWLTWLTHDTNQHVGDSMNYTAYGSDDRSGGTNITTVDGPIQQIDKNVTLFHRNLSDGAVTLISANGRPTTGAAADPYGDYDAQMRFGFDDTEDDNGNLINANSIDEAYIAWYDDREPGDDVDGSSTSDKLPEWETTNRFDVEWKVEQVGSGATAYRDSDTVAVRAAWLGNTRERAYTESRLSWEKDDDDDYDDANEFRWDLYAPTLPNRSLKKGSDLQWRVRPVTEGASACLSSTTTLAGCSLGRYQCRAGAIICGPANDAVCNQCSDFDGDGWPGHDPVFCPSGRDCNDNDPNTNPDAPESCDGFDNDCDGVIDVKDDDEYMAFWGEARPGTAANCPTGSRCGPAECNYNLTCVCENGGTGSDCLCGESLEEPENFTPVSTDLANDGAQEAPPSNDDADFSDPQAACTSAGTNAGSNYALIAYLMMVGWVVRRRQHKKSK